MYVVNKVVEDMTEECSKYGNVAAIEIPHVGGPGAGVGFVFVKYHSREDAQKVSPRMDMRRVCRPYNDFFFFKAAMRKACQEDIGRFWS